MPLVNMKDMLVHAHRTGYAVGAYDLVSLHFLEGIMAAAECDRAPVILSLAESHFRHFDFTLAMAATVAAARRASVPVAIHLDHGESLQSAIDAIRLGCNGVMFDGSHLPFAENVARTREVVEMAHRCGVTVEGELGYVPGVEGEDAELHPGELRMTTPDEAATFVEETGVDCIAVSIGTVHGRMRGTPRLDIDRLAAINHRLAMPLVIHGGTGLTEAQYRALIANGVSKINYFTALSDAAAETIRRNAAQGAKGHTGLLEGVHTAIEAECRRMNALWGSAGRAAGCLAACRPWREVEHLIIYNVAGIDEAEALSRAEEGRRVLGAIPGVRSIEHGVALDPDARYRFAWLIRFAAPEVVAHYRTHPDHVRFADEKFRPVAADRISIDYELG